MRLATATQMWITNLEVGCSHVPPKIDESGGTVRKEQRRRHSPLHKELWKKIAVRSAPLITATHIYGEYSKKTLVLYKHISQVF